MTNSMQLLHTHVPSIACVVNEVRCNNARTLDAVQINAVAANAHVAISMLCKSHGQVSS